MIKETRQINILLLLIVSLLFIVPHVQNDIVIPSYPDIMSFLQTTPIKFHFISSANFLGLAIGSLIFGSISDYINRINVLSSAMALMVISLIGIVLVQNVHSMMIFRFLQGVGSAGPITILVAIMFDLYDQKKVTQMTGFLDGMITAAKSIAPIIGAYVNFYFGWRANIYILISITLLALIILRIYFVKIYKQEVHAGAQKLEILALAKDVFQVFTNLKFSLLALFLGSMACSLVLFLNSSSLVFINHLGVDKKDFGIYQSLIMGSFAVFSFLTGLLVMRFGVRTTSKIAIIIAVIGDIIFIISAFLAPYPILIIAAMSICSSSFAILIAINLSRAMSIVKKNNGICSSLIAFIRLSMVSGLIAVAGIVYDGTMRPIAIIITLITILAVVINSQQDYSTAV